LIHIASNYISDYLKITELCARTIQDIEFFVDIYPFYPRYFSLRLILCVLKRIFGRKREEVVGGWRRLHSEESHNLYTSPDIIRVIRSRRMIWSGHVSLMKTMRNAYKILVGKPEGKRPLGRPRSRWEGNIRTVLKGTGWEGVDWIHLAQDRVQWRTLVDPVMNFRAQ
jgi:hypothetical protein